MTLHVRLTEIGTLELWCGEVAGPRTWKLQFDIRAATRTDLAGHGGAGERSGIVEQATLDACRTLIERTFGPVPADQREKPEQLIKRLAEVIGLQRAPIGRHRCCATVGNNLGFRAGPQAQSGARSPLA